MKDLHDIGLRGRLPNFISNFLSDRSFNVRIGSTLSDTFEQEQGVPQGSILSPTLCNINDRLVRFLESYNLISGNQAGFRKNYSTNDHLVI